LLFAILRARGIPESQFDNYVPHSKTEMDSKTFSDLIFARISAALNEKQYLVAQEYIKLLSPENLKTSETFFQNLLRQYRSAPLKSELKKELYNILLSILISREETFFLMLDEDE